MKRTKTKYNDPPSAILTADWHLREDQPVCRTDDFWREQWNKVEFISELQEKYDCPVIHAGDLFNHWKPSPYLLSQTIERIPDSLWTIYGNHDLPQHNMELSIKSGVHTLNKAQVLHTFSFIKELVKGWEVDGIHWNEIPIDKTEVNEKTRILVWHVMNYQKKPWPGCTDPMAGKLLRKYPRYNLIVTGHNHQAFVEEYEGRLLVNPGSLTRHAADQVDFRPRVYLWWEQENKVEPVYLPIKIGVISREHIKKVEERDGRIEAFISRLDEDWEATMNFEENLEQFAKTNKVRTKVMDIVYKAIEIS